MAMLTSLFFGLTAVLLAAMFEGDTILPIEWSLAFAALSIVYGLLFVRLVRLSLLAKVYIIVYALPFIHCVPYLWFDWSSRPPNMWCLTANPYSFDPEIIARMTMIGAIGALSLVSGLGLAQVGQCRKAQPTATLPALTPVSFAAVAFISLSLSWLNAPKMTILEAAYTGSESWLAGTNFNGAWMISYIAAAILIADVFQEKIPYRRRLKTLTAFVVVAVIVVWFQFMRGDRECAGLIVAIPGLYVLANSDKPFTRTMLMRAGLTVVVLVVVALAAQMLGYLRSELSRADLAGSLGTIPLRIESLICGTWSAVLLTPLSVVGDFKNGLMEARWGQTYVDYLLSVPPGFFTRMLGIERAIEGTHGPAWEMRYGCGGTHALVVPFMNFKAFGVVIVLWLYGLGIGWVERMAAGHSSMHWRLLYATGFIVAPHWFWYGEMNLVRALMAWLCLWLLYACLPKSSYPGLAATTNVTRGLRLKTGASPPLSGSAATC